MELTQDIQSTTSTSGQASEHSNSSDDQEHKSNDRRSSDPGTAAHNALDLDAESVGGDDGSGKHADKEKKTKNNDVHDGDDSGDYKDDPRTTRSGRRFDVVSDTKLHLGITDHGYQKLQDENNRVREELRQIKMKRADDTKNQKSLNSRLRTSEGNNGKLRAENIRLNEQLRNTLEDHRTAVLEIERKFVEAEAEVRDREPKDRFDALPDDIVRKMFQNIRDAISSWCRTWASSTNDLKIGQLHDFLLIGTIDDSKTNMKRLGELFSEWKMCARVLCNAHVAFEVFGLMIGHPFSFLRFHNRERQLETIFAKLYNVLRDRNIPSAETWRAHIVRGLIDFMSFRSDSTNSCSNAGKNSSLYRCDKSAETCFKKVSPLLKRLGRNDKAESKRELEMIFDDASQLAIQLWSQRTSIDIGITKAFEHPFSVSSPVVQPHSSMGLDDDDKQFDGSLCDFVVSPAVVARGDSSGQRYEHSKVWLKATVKIFDDGRLRREDESNQIARDRDKIDNQLYKASNKKRSHQSEIDTSVPSKSLKMEHENSISTCDLGSFDTAHPSYQSVHHEDGQANLIGPNLPAERSPASNSNFENESSTSKMASNAKETTIVIDGIDDSNPGTEEPKEMHRGMKFRPSLTAAGDVRVSRSDLGSTFLTLIHEIEKQAPPRSTETSHHTYDSKQMHEGI